MSNTQDFPLKSSAHSGGFVRNEILAGHGLSMIVAAKVLGVPRSVLSEVLNEGRALVPDMAQQLEYASSMAVGTSGASFTRAQAMQAIREPMRRKKRCV